VRVGRRGALGGTPMFDSNDSGDQLSFKDFLINQTPLAAAKSVQVAQRRMRLITYS
jgi:hypothetical protein